MSKTNQINVDYERVFISHICNNARRTRERLQCPKPTPVSWEFIPSNEGFLSNFISIVRKDGKFIWGTKFLDAGCGVSPILIALRSMGISRSMLYGIELDDACIKEMKEYHDIPKIYKLNLLSNTKSIRNLYSDIDVMYSYMPLKNHLNYFQYMKIALNNLKVGAIVMDFHGPLHELLDIENYKYNIEENKFLHTAKKFEKLTLDGQDYGSKTYYKKIKE